MESSTIDPFPADASEQSIKQKPDIWKYITWGAGIVVVAGLVLFGLYIGGEGEPVRDGRPASYWIRQLKSKDTMMRWRAATNLTLIGPPHSTPAVEDLIPLLEDPEYLVRMEAALALGRIRGDAKAAVPALIKSLKDHVPIVKDYAGKALEAIDPVAAWEAGVR